MSCLTHSSLRTAAAPRPGSPIRIMAMAMCSLCGRAVSPQRRCYKNGLDLSEEPSIGEFDSQNSTNGHFVNNIGVAWQPTHPAYVQAGTNSNVYYFKNLYFGSSCSFACSDATQWFSGDPLLANTPYFDGAASADGQYKTARPPSEGTPTDHGSAARRCSSMVPTCGIVSGFGLVSSNSPAYNTGIDPTTDSC